jgi:hypothetical protein
MAEERVYVKYVVIKHPGSITVYQVATDVVDFLNGLSVDMRGNSSFVNKSIK